MKKSQQSPRPEQKTEEWPPNPETDSSLDPTESFLLFCVQEAPDDDQEAFTALSHHRTLKNDLWFWEKGANRRRSSP